ncbi:DUF3027 domain-containing protein [Nocardia africana]
MSAVSVSESGVRPILAEAVDLARRALLELQPTGVGEHLGVTGEDECAATHHFAATLPGYRGWRWEVVVAAAPDADHATVSESALLPGPDALVAPEFVPWDQRIRPGDLAPGDLLAPRVDDPRLVPGYLETGDPVVDEVCEEVGLGRRQVLSREGRLEAAERWYSEFGPDTEMARSAPGTCGVCGFFVPLAGALRSAFGVCANAMGADGRVVHVEYGCGAHSDTELPTGAGSPLYEAYDDAAIEIVPAEELTARDGSADAEQPAAAGSGPEEPAEDAADSAPAVAVDTGEPSSADPETEKAASAGPDTPAASTTAATQVGEDAAEAESPSIPVDDVPATSGSGTADASRADVDAHQPGTADDTPAAVGVEELSSDGDEVSGDAASMSASNTATGARAAHAEGVAAEPAEPAERDADRAPASDTVPAGSETEVARADTAGIAPAHTAAGPSAEAAEDAPADTAGTSATVDVTNAAADATDTAADAVAGGAVTGHEPAETAPAADATAAHEPADSAASPETASSSSASVVEAQESGTAAIAADAEGAAASAEAPSAAAGAAATDAEEESAQPAAADSAAEPAAAEEDRSTGERAADAGPVRYSDAWAVSAVRVQPGETGAAEEN